MNLSILFLILIPICVNSQLKVTGYVDERDWFNLHVKLLTFWIDLDQEITSGDVEIAATKSNDVKGLEIENNLNVEYLPILIDESFPNLVAYQAFNCSVKEIGYKNFQNLRNIQAVGLSENKISYIPTNTFRDLKKLQQLYLNNNKFKYIDGNFFEGLGNLRQLYFNHNNISNIKIDAFDSLPELRHLSLSNNNLTYIFPQYFANNQKLEWIRLKENTIKFMTPTMFDNMNEMKYVDLSGNDCINAPYRPSDFLEMKKNIKNYC